MFGVIRRVKVISICISILFLLSLVFFIVVYVKRSDILQGKLLQWTRSYVSILFPPKDLFAPIMEDTLELSKNSVFKCELNHKYIGEYGVGVQGITPNDKLTLSCTIEVAGKLFFTEQKRTQPIIQFGIDKYDGYYCLYKIGISELNSSNIKLTITIKSINYAPKNNIKIFVRRLSDE